MNALRFNPIDKNQLSFDTIQTDFKIVESFYMSTDKGYIIAAEIWKDTEVNRNIIEKIIEEKKKFKAFENEHSKIVYAYMNSRER